MFANRSGKGRKKDSGEGLGTSSTRKKGSRSEGGWSPGVGTSEGGQPGTSGGKRHEKINRPRKDKVERASDWTWGAHLSRCYPPPRYQTV